MNQISQVLNVEEKIILNRFQLRWYQSPIWDAIENKGYRKVLAVLPRRAGKDITAWNLAIRQCLKKVCLVFYALPTYSQGRKAIWDAIALDSNTEVPTKFLDFIPQSMVASINQQEMKVRFKNGSILQVIGADTYDQSLVGTNCYGLVLSEAALMDLDNVYAFARPILAANGGWCLILSTPRGKNALHRLYTVVKDMPDWHVIKMGIGETRHIADDVLADERAQMDEGLYLQEYECSWERGQQGLIYGNVLDKAKLERRITYVPYDPSLLVHVAIDIGVSDATALIFFQTVNDSSMVRIIDCYSNSNVGLDHYAEYLQKKPYRYGKYFAPHDLMVREWGGGAITRYEKARQMGIDFTVLDQIDLQDGIDNVLVNFNKLLIDETKCKSLINALENYRREWDDIHQVYKPKPVHSWASHMSDALRYLCMSLHKTKKGMTTEEFERQKAQALYGNQQLPRFFRDDIRYDRGIR